MDTVICAKKIEETLQQQIALMKTVYDYQKQLSQCVLNRSWDGIEQCVAQTAKASDQFLKLDKQCFLLLEQLNTSVDDSADFYSYIRELPEENRKQLQHTFRTLQHHVGMSKHENDSLAAYTDHACFLIDGLMQTAADEASGSVYTYAGTPSYTGGCGSLVIDTVF